VSTRSTKFRLDAPELGDAASIEAAVGPLRDRLEVVLNSLVPIGLPMLWPGSALPVVPLPAGESAVPGTTPEFAWADGGLIDRTTYVAFFGVVGHVYNNGVDPGSNQCRKPDKRGRFLSGADDFGSAAGAAGRMINFGARGNGSGLEVVTLGVTEIPAHAHEQGTEDYLGSGAPFGVGANLDNSGAAFGKGAAGQLGVASTASVGGGNSHQNKPPYQNDHVIVRIA
jgi:microcystin-dependent protein